MSLWFNLMINAEQIAHVAIVRIEGTDEPSSLNTYRWTYTRDNGTAHGEITHRYRDGAVELAQRVLGEIAERHRIAERMRS